MLPCASRKETVAGTLELTIAPVAESTTNVDAGTRDRYPTGLAISKV
jgi:hypothetical protein